MLWLPLVPAFQRHRIQVTIERLQRFIQYLPRYAHEPDGHSRLGAAYGVLVLHRRKKTPYGVLCTANMIRWNYL